MSEFKSQCGCTIHVAQWTSKRKIASVKYCETHKAKPLDAEIAGLRKDRERLDKLTGLMHHADVLICPDERGWTLTWRDSGTHLCEVRGKSIRELLDSAWSDAAMAEGKGAE